VRLLVLLLSLSGCAAPMRGLQAPSAWPQVTSWLEGAWKAGDVRLTYRLISNDSALVETFVTAKGRETMTVLHRDGAGLVLTHYCAQGNQPRLRLSAQTAESLTFSLADFTNREGAASMLVERRFTRRGDDIELAEVYRAPDGTLEPSTLLLKRQ